jgi:hypothetical protein
MQLPKIPKASDAEKLAALSAAEMSNSAILANKETGGKPWLLADPKLKRPFSDRLNGDVAAKLDFIYQHATPRMTKHEIINIAINEYAEKWLRENGYL